MRGLSFEQEVAENGSISNRHYISAGGMAIAVVTTSGAIGSATQATIVATQYWHKDHLGSTIAATNETGAVAGRYSYDPFGKRRNISGSYDAFGNIVIDWGLAGAGAGPDRGFTGHEHLDDLGIIHMNGRLYDPHIARMMQADPIIAGLVDAQYFNRYSYVFNRPTSLTDATGECPVCFWVIGAALFARAAGIIDTRTLRTILSIAVVPLLGPQGAWAAFGPGYALANVAIAGFVSGAISSGSLKGGFQGAFTAMLFYGAGQFATELGGGVEALKADPTSIWGNDGIGRALVHASAGCINAQISGGNCGRGAVTAGVGKYLSANLPGADIKDMGLGTVRAAVIGGTISVLGGGKFANGARTAAYQYVFNQSVLNGELAFQEGMRSIVQTFRGVWDAVVGPDISPAAQQVSGSGGFTLMFGAGVSADGGVVRERGGGACYFVSLCGLAGFGAAATVDASTSFSLGAPGVSAQLQTFGKLALPIGGIEVAPGYGTDGALIQAGRSWGVGAATGIKACVQVPVAKVTPDSKC